MTSPSLATLPRFYKITGNECVTIALYENRPDHSIHNSKESTNDEINVHDLLVKHPASTFLVKFSGDSMDDAHIPDGSMLVVDRSVQPASNMIIAAIVNGEFMVKRFIKNGSGMRLMPANSRYNPLPITPDTEFIVWGVVTNIIIDCMVN